MRKIILFVVLFAILMPFSVSANTEKIDIDGINYILSTEGYVAEVVGYGQERIDQVRTYGDNLVIPNNVMYGGMNYSVTSIGTGAFAGFWRLGSVTFPNSLTSIGDRAFSDCSGLKSVTIPNSVTSIGSAAFAGCSGLTSVIIPNSVTSIGESAFRGTGLTSVTIPNSVTSISNDTFRYCYGLTSVTIPNSVTSIGSMAFLSCSSLTSVTIPNSVTSIGSAAFAGCSGLTLVAIPNSVTSIGINAFDGCSGLTSVTIPNSVTSIGESAFNGCEGLTEVLCYTDFAPQGFSSCFGKTDISSITLQVYDYAVESFKALNLGFKDIIVFEKITDFNLTYYVDDEIYKTEQYKYEDEIIPEPNPTKRGHAFSGWSDIPATMPGKDVDVNGSFAWSKITKDKVVYQVTDTLNNYSAIIGNDNASGMITIASDIDFDYNYKVTSIVDNAFNGCKGITSIDIPATITNIGVRTFAGIDKLTDVTIYAENVPETDRTAFENSYVDYVTLHVPYGSVEKYKSVGPWKDFKEIVAIEGTEPISVETCVMPTISYLDGKLEFESETYGAECHYEIKVEDAKEGEGPEVTLSSAYEISVYASKEGYNDSEKNKATLYWVNVDPISTGIIDNEMRVNTNAILVQNNGSSISLSGLGEGADVMIYNISGQLIGQGKATGNRAVIDTNLSSGDICIIKIGDKSVKYFLR